MSDMMLGNLLLDVLRVDVVLLPITAVSFVDGCPESRVNFTRYLSVDVVGQRVYHRCKVVAFAAPHRVTLVPLDELLSKEQQLVLVCFRLAKLVLQVFFFFCCIPTIQLQS